MKKKKQPGPMYFVSKKIGSAGKCKTSKKGQAASKVKHIRLSPDQSAEYMQRFEGML